MHQLCISYSQAHVAKFILQRKEQFRKATHSCSSVAGRWRGPVRAAAFLRLWSRHGRHPLAHPRLPGLQQVQHALDIGVHRVTKACWLTQKNRKKRCYNETLSEYVCNVKTETHCSSDERHSLSFRGTSRNLRIYRFLKLRLTVKL